MFHVVNLQLHHFVGLSSQESNKFIEVYCCSMALNIETATRSKLPAMKSKYNQFIWYGSLNGWIERIQG
jgi:hypothetical protein